MKKPPCAKCGSSSTFVEVLRFSQDDVYLGCYTCGWRIYGETAIRSYVEGFNKQLAEQEEEARLERIRKREEDAIAAEAEKRERALALKRERDRRYRERKRQAALEIERQREAEKKVHIIPSLDISFSVGDMDPVLGVPWAQPVPNKEGEDLDPCAWPPCENRARPNSKYCSRKCTVRVAHRRDKLRKKGQLKERIAS